MTVLTFLAEHRDAVPEWIRVEVRAWASQPGLADLLIRGVSITPGQLHEGDLVVARTRADGTLIVDSETNSLVTDTVRRAWRTQFPPSAVEWLQQLPATRDSGASS